MGWVKLIIKKRTFLEQLPIIPNVEYQGILSTIKCSVPIYTYIKNTQIIVKS